MHPLLSDSRTWIDNFWLPLLVAAVVGVAGIAGWWVKTRGQRRYEADATGRLLVSRAFNAAATQMGALRLYTPSRSALDEDTLAERIAECLSLLHSIAYGEAAKTARNAGTARFNRFETNVVSFTVGNIQGFVEAYLSFQRIHDENPHAPLPAEALDLGTGNRATALPARCWTRTGSLPLGTSGSVTACACSCRRQGKPWGIKWCRRWGLLSGSVGCGTSDATRGLWGASGQQQTALMHRLSQEASSSGQQ